MKHVMPLVFSLAFASQLAAAPAANFAKMEVIKLVNGPNTVDLNGDGKKDMVFVAWRENYNAHGYSQFSFYLDLAGSAQAEKRWHLLPFFDESGAPKRDAINTIEGADCMLRDFRLLRASDKQGSMVTLIEAKRADGESFIDPAAVQFTVYEIKQNKDSDPGQPPFYFAPKTKINAKKNYCDVNEAFEKELGIKGKPAY